MKRPAAMSAGLSAACDRARVAAEARADVLRAGVRARIAAALPGIAVSEEGDRIRLSGRGLVRRWVAQAALRALRDGRDFGDGDVGGGEGER